MLTLQTQIEIGMNIARQIRERIAAMPEGFVFTASAISCDATRRGAAARALQRMAKKGELSKLTNGRYYKPRQSAFGALKPSPAQLINEYLVKDGDVIGYLTGPDAFSQYSLTTQISSDIQIGTNYYRRPIRRANYIITFLYQPNEIKEDRIEIFKILDCLKLIKNIPGTSANDACRRMICVIKDLSDEIKRKLVECAVRYRPSVRALLGAILEYIECGKELTEPLLQSLSGVSKYLIPISESILPTKLNWKIYEPTR